jgi:hypothetical protein
MIQRLNYISIPSTTERLLILCLQVFITCKYKMETTSSGYSCYIGAHGSIYTHKDTNVTKREPPVWLTFIGIFFSPRVMTAALKFGLAACLMNRFERLGFIIMLLCFALY